MHTLQVIVEGTMSPEEQLKLEVRDLLEDSRWSVLEESLKPLSPTSLTTIRITGK
jgi:hypothetical protein